jgi:predicted nuclease of predicted toxin-antitoxin system
VRLLLDENLSRRLVARLADLYPGSIHVADAGLLAVPDSAIWEYARGADFVIVTSDFDFCDLVAAAGPPPKVVWLRRWTHPTRDAEIVLRREAVRITSFAADPELGLLVLDR